ncbi:MAG: pro-sigmaK processing inhibitor BofA family protein [Clostridiales bacterium]|nr:pro-sigmaK processing inhibitor BofA family protein [Clostridiales bacterium]
MTLELLVSVLALGCGALAFHRSARPLLRLLCRTAAGGLFLALAASAGSWLGIGLGVNLFNSLVLGLLGPAGLGLLLMLRWSLLTGI